MNLLPYYKAASEELNRRLAIIDEVVRLYDITYKSIIKAGYDISTIHILQKDSIDILNKDIQTVSTLNEYIVQNKSLNPSFALKTNKLFELFNCATDILHHNIAVFIQRDIQEYFPMQYSVSTVLGGLDEVPDVKGTSAANCLQTALLSMLRAMNFPTNLHDLKLKSIYNVDTSPVIQGTYMPENFNYEVITGFKEWFYYYYDDKSPPQGELLVPTLGYAFGGSREDPRYRTKLFKTEDCSSSVSKWLHANIEFSTIDMAHAFSSECKDDDVSCKEVQRLLTPLSGLKDVEHGNIFVFRNPTNSGGHTGFVVQKINSTCFNSLSYSRNMIKIEGLGYQVFCEDDGNKYMYFLPKQYSKNEEYYEASNIIGAITPWQHIEL